MQNTRRPEEPAQAPDEKDDTGVKFPPDEYGGEAIAPTPFMDCTGVPA